jgi:hypothetical protein
MPNIGRPAVQEEPPALISALVTQHFSLQSISSATISESGSRAALYLSALSSGLVAIGFASSSRQDLEALAFSVVPTVFVLGWFTIVRLIHTSVQNLVSRRRTETIRQYHAAIDPRHAKLFEADAVAFGVLVCATAADRSFCHGQHDPAGQLRRCRGNRGACLRPGGRGAAAVGVVAAVASLALGLLYESRRFAALIARDAPAEATEELT